MRKFKTICFTMLSCCMAMLVLMGCQSTNSYKYRYSVDQTIVTPYSGYHNSSIYIYRYRNSMYYRPGFYSWGRYQPGYYSYSRYYYYR